MKLAPDRMVGMQSKPNRTVCIVAKTSYVVCFDDAVYLERFHRPWKCAIYGNDVVRLTMLPARFGVIYISVNNVDA